MNEVYYDYLRLIQTVIVSKYDFHVLYNGMVQLNYCAITTTTTTTTTAAAAAAAATTTTTTTITTSTKAIRCMLNIISHGYNYTSILKTYCLKPIKGASV